MFGRLSGPVMVSFTQPSVAQRRRSRVGAFALSVLMVMLGAGALLNIGWMRERAASPMAGHLVSMAMDRGEKQASAKKAVAQVAQKSKVTPDVPEPVPVEQAPPPPSYIRLSHNDFAASDISKMGRAANADVAAAKAGAFGPGDGPGGAHLYAAQWYREPFDAELSPYMPRSGAPQGAWATIACRTVEKFHVEDCREMDEQPLGSGLARALRQASWQFLVRPPRVNGEAQVGAWVRIRFDFVDRK
jgi:hypothetical protein